jgi:hypothetical protein
MMYLYNSLCLRDSSRLTALRMTTTLGHVILSEAKDLVFRNEVPYLPYNEILRAYLRSE